MIRRERKYALDTNLFIQGFRDTNANAALQVFHTAFAPFEYLSAIVVQELRAGTRAEDAAKLERTIFAPFERRGRLLSPTYAAWKRSGEVLAALVAAEGLELRRVPRSVVNDVLLAVSCRENGVTLISDNSRDFSRIQRIVAFDFLEPWPQPIS